MRRPPVIFVIQSEDRDSLKAAVSELDLEIRRVDEWVQSCSECESLRKAHKRAIKQFTALSKKKGVMFDTPKPKLKLCDECISNPMRFDIPVWTVVADHLQ